MVGSLKRTRAILDAVGKACDLPNFHAKIDIASAKNMGDKIKNSWHYVYIYERFASCWAYNP